MFLKGYAAKHKYHNIGSVYIACRRKISLVNNLKFLTFVNNFHIVIFRNKQSICVKIKIHSSLNGKIMLSTIRWKYHLNMGSNIKLDWNNPKSQYSISHRNHSSNRYAINSFTE